MVTKPRFIPYLFILPAVLMLLVFSVIPTFATLTESLYGLSFKSGRIFVGLENFKRIFSDPVFWTSLQTTLVFNLLINPIQIALALLLALLANQAVKGISFFRSIYLLPVAVSINVTTVVWGLMLDRDAGVLNGILAYLGLERQPFLLSPDQAMWSMILLASWKGVPFWSLFFLAGLQGIPQSAVEAAKVDGANRWTVFSRITFPLLRRTTAFVLVADTVANFIFFIPVLVLTQGGPELSTNLMMYEVYRRGFVYGDLGASAAMLSMMLVVVFVIVGLELWLFRDR
jgi:multiple sugar transport system permease protein